MAVSGCGGVGEQVRVLLVTKKDGMKKRTHCTVDYKPILPPNAGDIIMDFEIVDPSSQPEAGGG